MEVIFFLVLAALVLAGIITALRRKDRGKWVDRPTQERIPDKEQSVISDVFFEIIEPLRKRKPDDAGSH